MPVASVINALRFPPDNLTTVKPADKAVPLTSSCPTTVAPGTYVPVKKLKLYSQLDPPAVHALAYGTFVTTISVPFTNWGLIFTLSPGETDGEIGLFEESFTTKSAYQPELLVQLTAFWLVVRVDDAGW